MCHSQFPDKIKSFAHISRKKDDARRRTKRTYVTAKYTSFCEWGDRVRRCAVAYLGSTYGKGGIEHKGCDSHTSSTRSQVHIGVGFFER